MCGLSGCAWAAKIPAKKRYAHSEWVSEWCDRKKKHTKIRTKERDVTTQLSRYVGGRSLLAHEGAVYHLAEWRRLLAHKWLAVIWLSRYASVFNKVCWYINVWFIGCGDMVVTICRMVDSVCTWLYSLCVFTIGRILTSQWPCQARWRGPLPFGPYPHAPSLHAKQSFQSNKTHRKLCEVLTTYQNLFYRKTLKKKV